MSFIFLLCILCESTFSIICDCAAYINVLHSVLIIKKQKLFIHTLLLHCANPLFMCYLLTQALVTLSTSVSHAIHKESFSHKVGVQTQLWKNRSWETAFRSKASLINMNFRRIGDTLKDATGLLNVNDCWMDSEDCW